MDIPITTLGRRYRLTELVGKGGLGTVWLAADEVLHRTVAAKILQPELLHISGFADRFRTRPA
jgi:serine/threonine-protein kinase